MLSLLMPLPAPGIARSTRQTDSPIPVVAVVVTGTVVAVVPLDRLPCPLVMSLILLFH